MNMNIKIIIYILTILINISMANDSYFGLDEFDDLELKPLDYPKKNIQNKSQGKQKLILFDDNLYLLEDDFDFGLDEIELQKIDLDPKDLETAREYENFLNVFFENSPLAGSSLQNNARSNSLNYSNKRNRNQNITKTNDWNRKSIYQTPKSTRLPSNRPPSKGLGFRVSTILGTSIPMGSNLTSNFSSGSNFGVHLQSPISFKIGNLDGIAGTDIYLSSMPSNSGSPYNLTSITGTISLFLLKNQALEIKSGFGISPSSIGDRSNIFPSIPVDLNYYFIEIKDFRVALNLHAQMTLGYPNDGTAESGSEATTEFINVGLTIKTPLTF